MQVEDKIEKLQKLMVEFAPLEAKFINAKVTSAQVNFPSPSPSPSPLPPPAPPPAPLPPPLPPNTH